MPLRCLARPFALAIAVAAIVSPACGEITPDAQRVVDRYVTAAGGKAAFDTLRAMRIHAHVQALGLTGTTISWTQRPDRSASDMRLGPLHIPEGFDGTTGWRGDPGGQVLALDGKDLEEARASAWFENLMWLTPGEGGGSIRAAGTQRDSAGSYTVLVIAPPAGRARRYWFDDRTGLADREDMKQDQQNLTATMSDYRPVGGWRVPFRSVARIEGMPANDLTVLVDSVVVNPVIDPATFRPPAAESSRIAWLKTPGRAQVAFRYSGQHVWVSASVNGAPPADFLFDTGASITIIDSTYAAELGLATEGELQSQGAGSTGSARFSQISTLRLDGAAGDGVTIAAQKVGVLSINPLLEPFFWHRCAGVIGADFITRVVTEIDYDRGTLVFSDPATFQYAGKGAAVPFVLAGHMPAVTMTLDGKFTGDFRVDVGSGSTVDLHAPFVARLHIDEQATGRRVTVVGGGFGGTFTSTLTRMKSLQIGPYSWQDPLLSFSGASSGALASEDYAGNIGNRLLERFKCTFDYQRRMLHLEPSARYTERDRFTRAGVQLARYGNEVLAMQVVPGSPAARAGLREGDAVASVDGRAARDWTADELRQLFEDGNVGRTVTLEVLRANKPRKLRFRLADVL
jgi:hypothetical protein